MPVPGDLPVFLNIALAVNRLQHHEHRLATLVIPDRPSVAVDEIVTGAQEDWSGSLQVKCLPCPERWILPRLNQAWRNYGVQIVTGTRQARSSHVLFHDADLFPLTPSLLDAHYGECRDRELACLGLSPYWDSWFAEHGRNLAATWELCVSTAWMRSFAPYLHFSHGAVVLGELHGCDVTAHPQVATEPARIAVHEREEDYVHFNYVIGTYRDFQANPKGFVDDRFRLLLIRVFIDLFDPDRRHYEVPSLYDLAAGLREPEAVVTYPDAAMARDDYQQFRSKLRRILDAEWWAGPRRSCDLSPFDEYYA